MARATTVYVSKPKLRQTTVLMKATCVYCLREVHKHVSLDVAQVIGPFLVSPEFQCECGETLRIAA